MDIGTDADFLTLLEGDAVENLRTLETGSVQCVVTSPPFWGLRDYGTARWEGGDDDCDHKYSVSSPYNENFNERWGNASGAKKQESERHEVSYKSDCGKCGAKRIDSQLGLEKTPEEYVAKMVGVFREVRRVLRKDGTLWLNLGDSYAGAIGASPSNNGVTSEKQASNDGAYRCGGAPGLKPKDLCGIPWRVAFALQADGWWLRSDIIWAKPNPMPESVTDRPTKSHEYLFLLTKASSYFYDAESIQEKAAYDGRKDTLLKPSEKYAARNIHANSEPNTMTTDGAQRWRRKHDDTNHGGNGTGFQDHCGYDKLNHPYVRNKRSVWTVTTQPYADAHFATYPPDLIKPCIMAGSRVGDTVLDPFGGSGTTGMVALELGRKAVLIELNPEYCKLIEKRCTVTLGLSLTA